jgi:beta-lactamase superfamily II metal-dependent hydrolase
MKRIPLITVVAAVLLVSLVYVLTKGRWSSHDVSDTGSPAVTVRVLDVWQGDATYIHNGDSRVIIDVGPKEERFGALLDSLELNNTTIDVVILTHQHYDHYNGLLALFESVRSWT